MEKRRSIKEQLVSTTSSSKIDTEERLKKLDLNERINKAEAIVRNNKTEKPIVEKVIRDAFTMQKSDIVSLEEIKQKCLRSGIEVNKSMIVRAGIQTLIDMPIDRLNKIITNLPKVKVGRPKV